MLPHTSNTTLQFIFSNSILHNEIHIKASKVSCFKEAHKWLLYYFVSKIFSQIAIQGGMTITKDLFSHSCLKISTNSSNYALFTSHSTSFSLKLWNQFLQPLYRHIDTSFFIIWIVLWTKSFNALKMGRLGNPSFKLSTIACTYSTPITLHSCHVSFR